MRVGFVGTGHIAAPMARALVRAGHDIRVSRRNADVAAALVAGFPEIEVADNQSVVDGADIVFLCLRPAIAPKVVPDLAFAPGQKIVSVMAGVAMEDLAQWCAPAEDICITIPLGFVEQGGCPLAVFPHGATLTPLFGDKNPIIPLDSEAALDGCFAACALVPGILSLLEEGTAWLADHIGDAASAERYVTGLMSGFLNAMPKNPGDLARERAALATPNTLSETMVAGLAKRRAREAIRDSMTDVSKKLDGSA